MRIGVMIPAYNEEENIAFCLKSLLHQTFRPTQVVICDNESTDSTREIATEILSGSGVQFHIVTERRRPLVGKWNISFAYWRASQYLRKDLDLVACLEADVILDGNYYEILSHGFSNPRLGLACGVLLPLGFPLTVWGFPFTESWRNKLIWGPNRVYRYSCWLDLNRVVDLRLLPVWDTDHNVLAIIRGWETAWFERAFSRHIRPTSDFRGFCRGLADRYTGYPTWWILYKTLINTIRYKTFDLARLIGYSCMAIWGGFSPLREVYRQAITSALRRQVRRMLFLGKA